MANEKQPEIVVDRGGSKISDLWKKEDYWAIWIGFFVLLVGLVVFFGGAPSDLNEKIAKQNQVMSTEAAKPFKTIEWYKAHDAKGKLQGTKWVGWTGKLTSRPHKWKSSVVHSMYVSDEAAKAASEKGKDKYAKAKEKEGAALAAAQAAQAAAGAAAFKDGKLNDAASAAIADWRSAHKKAGSAKKKAHVKPVNQVWWTIGLFIILAIIMGFGWSVMGGSFGKFVTGFIFVFILALLAFIVSRSPTASKWGIGYALWAILFGLIIANTVGTPKWVLEACQVEYFIKTGLVILGAEILFGKIVQIGIPGIFVAWVVTPIVLITTYIFGQKVVKMPSKTLNITISADMSVCGVSAAIATAAACRAKKEELTLAVGLSLVFTSIMMVVMPLFIKAVGMPVVLGGAWMGGTIDATGAVAAAGAMLGDKGMYVAATIKMIQNVLIGVTAFCVAVYWCAKVDCVEGEKVRASEIWFRFPKFVLGFIGASILFSVIYGAIGADVGYTIIDKGVLAGLTKNMRYWFFGLAFVSIGLVTNFRELKEQFVGGKPLILYVCGQSFNLILTLLMAYVMFYMVFPEITAKI